MHEILSQQEIDSLLQAFSAGQSSRARRNASGVSEVRLYDFRRPERFSKEQLTRIENVSRALATSLSSHLSSALAATISIQFSTLQQCSFEEYLTGAPEAPLFSSFRIDPAGARSLIEINPNLVCAFVDLMTGGDGGAVSEARDLTEIEMKLMESVIRPALKQYTRAWEPYGHTFCDLERVGANLTTSPVAGAHDRMLVTTFEVQVASQTGLMSLCVPAHAIEAIMHDFEQRAAASSAGADPAIQQAICDQLGSSSVYLEARLGTARLSINNLLDLKPGDCVRLDNSATSEIVISVKSQPKYKAVPGVVGRRIGVQITRELTEEEALALQD